MSQLEETTYALSKVERLEIYQFLNTVAGKKLTALARLATPRDTSNNHDDDGPMFNRGYGWHKCIEFIFDQVKTISPEKEKPPQLEPAE